MGEPTAAAVLLFSMAIPDGSGFQTNYQAGPAAAQIYPVFQFSYDDRVYNMSAVNGIRVAEEEDDYPWIGNTPDFVLVGSTSAHPSNHYAKTNMNVLLWGLAEMYHQRWNLLLAYNDSGLIRGGVFDLGANYSPPHHEHNIGENQDVRANGAAYSIPNNAEIREWFENTVREMFSGFLHESVGTGNEHYHVRY